MFFLDEKPPICRYMWWLLGLSVFGVNTLYSLVLAPLYVWASTDVDFLYTAWPEAIELLMNLCSIFVYFLSYAVIVYARYRCSKKTFWRFWLVAEAAIVYKYGMNLAVSWITDGRPSAGTLTLSLLSVLVYVILETALLGLISFLAAYLLQKAALAYRARCNAARRLKEDPCSPHAFLFPFSSIFSLSHPLQSISFWAALAVSVTKVLARVRYDIFIGAPTSAADITWMILYYLSDLLLGLLGYFIMIFVLNQLYLKDTEST